MQTKCFPDNTFNAIPVHGISRFSVYTYAESTVGLIALEVNKGKSVSAHPAAELVDLIKLPGFPEKTGFREPVLLHPKLSGQPLTPLGTPALDYCLAGTGPHTGPKSVGTFTLEVTGLKSSLTHDIIPLTVTGLLTDRRLNGTADSFQWLHFLQLLRADCRMRK